MAVNYQIHSCLRFYRLRDAVLASTRGAVVFTRFACPRLSRHSVCQSV